MHALIASKIKYKYKNKMVLIIDLMQFLSHTVARIMYASFSVLIFLLRNMREKKVDRKFSSSFFLETLQNVGEFVFILASTECTCTVKGINRAMNAM